LELRMAELAELAELVSYELDGGVARITMDDGKRNVFSIRMLTALHAAFDRAESDEAVVILTGREGCFSAGFDLGVFASGEQQQVLEMLRLGATLAERVLGFGRPVVAACTGHAVAAGTFVLLAADVRIGVDGEFKLGLNEVGIGLTVPWFVVELARQRLQTTAFDKAVVGARMHTPAQAAAAGFLDEVVAARELAAASTRAAASLGELDGAAHAATKLRARAGALAAVRAAIESELGPDRV
jgi:enoyl-CoA hydratase